MDFYTGFRIAILVYLENSHFKDANSHEKLLHENSTHTTDLSTRYRKIYLRWMLTTYHVIAAKEWRETNRDFEFM